MRTSDPEQIVSLTGWAVAVAVGSAVLLLAVFGAHLGPSLATALENAFMLVCHQLDGRRFSVGAASVLVCHRCTGILIGLLVAALLFPLMARGDRLLWRYARSIILLSLVPMGVDWALDFVAVLANTPFSRLATGAVFGLTAGYFAARGVALRRSRPSRRDAHSGGAAGLVPLEGEHHQP